ncbi:MAG: SRPBCC family protein [Verrucomicrobiota bacterium]
MKKKRRSWEFWAATVAVGMSLGGMLRADDATARAACGDEANWAALQTGEVVIIEQDDGKENGPQHVVAGILIDAPVKVVWDAIADKEGAPEYVENLKSAKILKNHPDYQLIEQKMKLSFLLPAFTYVVRHTPTPHSRVDFVRESGDLKHIEGYWRFIPVAEGKKTVLIYSLFVDPGMLIPQAIIRGSMKKSLPEVLMILQERCAEAAGN